MSQNEVSPAPQEVNKIQLVRNQIVDTILVVGTLISLISLFATIINELNMGWQPETTGFIVLVAWLVILTLLRHRVPYRLKTLTILTILYLGGVLNLLGWGLIGGGEIWFVVMVLFTLQFYDSRAGLISLVIGVLTMTGITIAVQSGNLGFDIDYTTYMYTFSSWVTRILTFVLVSVLLSVSLWRVFSVLQDQLAVFRRRTDELIEEIDKREHAEISLADAVEQLKDLDRLKDEFIDSISHELRTPIANIQLYHQLLGMNPAKAKEYLATLQTETERLAHIVEQLLHASSDVYDMALTTMVDIDLEALTHALFKTHTEALEKEGISLQFSPVDEEFITLASPGHIERALGNLVDNAVKYTLTGGHIHVAMSRKEHGGRKMVGVLIENTSDDLSGLDEKILFDRFTRGENSLKQGIAGVGLGLSIARQIVEQYTGHIDFDYDAGKETVTFSLWLPANVPMAEFLSDDKALPEPSA